MSKSHTPIYLLVAALSVVLAAWQPRDLLAERASPKLARIVQGGAHHHAAAGPSALDRR